jgi:hypothetical protein
MLQLHLTTSNSDSPTPGLGLESTMERRPAAERIPGAKSDIARKALGIARKALGMLKNGGTVVSLTPDGEVEWRTDRAIGIVSGLNTLLKHPLILLLIGAYLSSVFIPKWTLQWQNREAELGMKAAHIKSVDQTVTETLLVMESLVVRYNYPPERRPDRTVVEEELNAARFNWEVQAAVIQSQLNLYYPGTIVTDDWTELSTLIREMISKIGYSDYRAEFGRYRATIRARTTQLHDDILKTPIVAFR